MTRAYSADSNQSFFCMNSRHSMRHFIWMRIYCPMTGGDAWRHSLSPCGARTARWRFSRIIEELRGVDQGTDLEALAAKRGIKKLQATRSGGHYYWRSGRGASEIFADALRISSERWPEVCRFRPVIQGAWHTPDEVVVSIALELNGGGSLPSSKGMVLAENLEAADAETVFVHY